MSVAIRWALGDIEYLSTNYGKIPTREIALTLNLSKSTVTAMARKLGLEANHNWPVSDVTREKQRLARIGKSSGMKGRHHTEETKRKLGIAVSAALKGRIPSNLTLIQSMPKRHLSGDMSPSKRPEVRLKISLSKMGDKNPMKRPEVRQKVSASKRDNPTRYWLGKKRSKETIEKIVATRSKNPVRYWLGKKRDPETVKKMSAGRKGKKNPKHSLFLKNFYKEHPEKHANFVMARNHPESKGYISRPQRKMFSLLSQIYEDATLEYPIIVESGVKFADVGIPSKKLDFEYDEEHWHKDASVDMERDAAVLKAGWKVIRISNKDNMEQCIKTEVAV